MSHRQIILSCFFALIAMLAAPALIYGQTLGEATPPAEDILPVIMFEESTYDFGEITEGDVVTHVFTFTNTGDQPLILTSVKGSCGCTVPKWPTEPIWPQETSSFTVMFDSKGKSGKQAKRVTVTANTEPAHHFLTISGMVLTREDQQDNTTAPKATSSDILTDCFIIYPNPTTSTVSIRIDPEYNEQDVTVSIYSDNGQTMASRTTSKTQGDITFTVDHYPPGNYLAKVQIGGKAVETRCFVVVK